MQTKQRPLLFVRAMLDKDMAAALRPCLCFFYPRRETCVMVQNMKPSPLYTGYSIEAKRGWGRIGGGPTSQEANSTQARAWSNRGIVGEIGGRDLTARLRLTGVPDLRYGLSIRKREDQRPAVNRT